MQIARIHFQTRSSVFLLRRNNSGRMATAKQHRKAVGRVLHSAGGVDIIKRYCVSKMSVGAEEYGKISELCRCI